MKKVITFAMLLCAAGCTSVSVVSQNEAAYAPTVPCKVQYLTSKPDRSHEELAVLEWTAGTGEMKQPAVEKKACSLGGQALVITSRPQLDYGGVSRGTATVIRFR